MAAKSYMETDRQVRGIIEDVKAGTFKPVYLLMGEEPYYPEKVCAAIIDNCLQEWEKDFNELICYGADVDADAVITAARRFPMMADRQLVVVKEAQAMKSLEDLALYCQKPLDSTVLVILLHGASVDKRKALYKTVLKQGVIVESLPLRDYETEKWVVSFYEEKGLSSRALSWNPCRSGTTRRRSGSFPSTRKRVCRSILKAPGCWWNRPVPTSGRSPSKRRNS